MVNKAQEIQGSVLQGMGAPNGAPEQQQQQQPLKAFEMCIVDGANCIVPHRGVLGHLLKPNDMVSAARVEESVCVPVSVFGALLCLWYGHMLLSCGLEERQDNMRGTQWLCRRA